MSLLSGYLLLTTSSGYQCSSSRVLSQRIQAFGPCYEVLDSVTGSVQSSYRDYLQRATGGGTEDEWNFLHSSYTGSACSGSPSNRTTGPFTAGSKCYISNYGNPTPPNPDSNLGIATSFTFSFTPGLSLSSIPSMSLAGIVFTSYSSSCAASPAPLLAASWVYSPYQCYWNSTGASSLFYQCYQSIPSTYWIDTYPNTPICSQGPGLHSHTQQKLGFSSCAAGPRTNQSDSKYLYLQNSCTNTATPGPSAQPRATPRLSMAPSRSLTPGALTGIGIGLSCLFSFCFALRRRGMQNQLNLGVANNVRDAGAEEATSNPVAAIAMSPLSSEPPIVYATAVVVDHIPEKEY